ncbi:MAG: hypothetical protein OEY09_19030, partial [Gammaproteobacteria bacterium]|nr:hypothetical protein [Gammaproteobacteria bacterium]
MSEIPVKNPINKATGHSAIFILSIGLVFLLATCTDVTRSIPAPKTARALQSEVITGVTTNEGEWINFDKEPSATITDPESAEEPIIIKATVGGEPYEIKLSEVQRIWVIRQELNQEGAVLALVAILAVIVNQVDDQESEPETSCPFIYSWNGNKFVMDAEPYGGATTRGLARDDYSELENLVAEDGYYRLLVRNEMRETQYTDLMELVVVDHAPGERVIADERGRFYSISDASPPVMARDHIGNDLRHWLVDKDQKIWEALPVADDNGN